MTLDLSRWSPSLTAFAEWLEDEDTIAAKLWSKRLKSADTPQAESAVAEAVVWDFIGCRCDAIHLAEDPGRGGVDFECVAGGTFFLVEVTNISIQAAADASKMPDTELFKGYYGLLTWVTLCSGRRGIARAPGLASHHPCTCQSDRPRSTQRNDISRTTTL